MDRMSRHVAEDDRMSRYVAEDGLELLTLPPPPTCWDDRCGPPWLVCAVLGIKRKASTLPINLRPPAQKETYLVLINKDFWDAS